VALTPFRGQAAASGRPNCWAEAGGPAKIAVCGSGNAGHALVVAMSRSFDGSVVWLVGSQERAELLRRNLSPEGLHSTGVVADTARRLSMISSDPSAVIPDADLVLISVPAFAHRTVLERIQPFLNPTAAVGCLPARGGFEFEASYVLSPDITTSRRVFFGLQTFPWSARIKTPGRQVHFGAAKADVFLAASDGDEIAFASELTRLLGVHIAPTAGFLALTLGNPGQFIHPGLMYGHFRRWRGRPYDADTVPRFYADATDEMGDTVEQLSQEAMAIAAAFETRSGFTLDASGVVGVHDWLRAAYADVTADMTTVGSCFRTGPIRARVAPMREVAPGKLAPDFTYRYLSEDVPFGLVVTRGLGSIAGVPTPTIDEVINWAQSVSQREYLRNGRLTGADVRHLPIPQNYGFRTEASLIDWYRRMAAHRSRVH
jgi:NAD/NADP octopine/nopaline dehydrogenase-like protein/ketopantoate reductase PanE/ApbA-like protein